MVTTGATAATGIATMADAMLPWLSFTESVTEYAPAWLGVNVNVDACVTAPAGSVYGAPLRVTVQA